MKFLARVLLTAAVGLASIAAWAQADAPKATWKARLDPADARPGEHARVIVEGEFSEGGFVYSPQFDSYQVELAVKAPEGAPYALDGAMILPKAHVSFDELEKKNVAKFKGGMALAIPIVLNADAKGEAAVDFTFQVCNDRLCANPTTIPLSFKIGSGTPRAEFAATNAEVPEQPAAYIVPKDDLAPIGAGGGAAVDETMKQINEAKAKGPLALFVLAFVAGLLALLTPCVWPMIPVTVSFFSKSASDKKKNLHGALAYCFGIIGTFTLLGLAVTAISSAAGRGASGTQDLAANSWVNLAMAVLFVVLAASLFGVFELQLPPALINKLQKKTKVGGLVGPMMMGLVFSLTSFTCTVPFAGSVLASAAGGDWFYPTIGMIGFSMAFALPFFLLALFPQWLAKLPQSGTWMITFKAFLGFLELAAALKFLSNTDMVERWKILPVETFLSIWAALFLMAGMYLLGWIRLPKDMTTKIGNWRRLAGAATCVAGLYCFAVIQGAPFGQLVGFLPNYEAERKHKLPWIENFEQGRVAAQTENKLLFINFTGVTCVNCRQMENNVFPTPAVKEELLKFTLVELYTDQNTEVDRANAKLREQLTGAITNPIYVVMEPSSGKVLKVFQGGTPNHQEFIDFLNEARGEDAVASR